ncbi:MAG TPA: hypothetical protein VNW15_07800 [Rhizomicrobium sp.]|nr:hypothetical protein [Rhizomicrobium sp.]
MDDEQAARTVAVQLRRTAGYLARAEIERLLEPLRSHAKRLEPFGYKVYSQNDEDGILSEIFSRLKIAAGLFCEIGVENGLECNTLYLIHKGWRGCWLERNESQRAPISTTFASLIHSNRLVLGLGVISPGNVNRAITGALAAIGRGPQELDFLSVDIDGMDIYLWEALAFSPKVICIEYNAKFPPPLVKKPVLDPDNVWRGGDYMGSSLSALYETGGKKGYTLVGTNIVGGNAFFVRSDLASDLFDANPTAEHLYNPPRYWLYFDHFIGGIGHNADFGPYTDLV